MEPSTLAVSTNRMFRYYSQRIPRKARKSLWIVVLLFITFLLFVVHNLFLVLMVMRGGETEKKPIMPGQDTMIGKAMQVAFQSNWVGIEQLKDYPCQEALTNPRNAEVEFAGESLPMQMDDSVFSADVDDCSDYRKRFGYDRLVGVSPEELDFPLAFIILFHSDYHQVHLLLRAIYRPHNVYCLHPDSKSSPYVMAAAWNAAKCLPNVFVATKLERVIYAGFSRLKADINCMHDLIKHPVKWNYVINMAGKAFPLRTNLEMVRILQLYNGANDVEGSTETVWVKPYRFKYKHQVLDGKTVNITNVTNPPPPHGLRMVKGNAYNTLSRPFVRFVLTDQRSIDLLDWCKDVYSPDEYFWSVLNHNVGLMAPGQYEGIPKGKPYLTSFAVWELGPLECATYNFVRDICILTSRDFPLLRSRFELFANKFYLNYYPSATHCLDQLNFNRSITGFVGDMEYYKSLKFSLPMKFNK